MRDGRDLDIALAGQTLEIEISQAEGNTEFDGKGALSGPTISVELAEEKEVSLTL
jgi:hypothetical protein